MPIFSARVFPSGPWKQMPYHVRAVYRTVRVSDPGDRAVGGLYHKGVSVVHDPQYTPVVIADCKSYMFMRFPATFQSRVRMPSHAYSRAIAF